jgi:hypothetical protein
MKITLPALAAAALAVWFLLPKRTQRAIAPKAAPVAWDGDALNTGEELQRTHAMGVNEGIGRSIRQSDQERLYSLGTEPGADPESDRIVPGLPDYLRGG